MLLGVRLLMTLWKAIMELFLLMAKQVVEKLLLCMDRIYLTNNLWVLCQEQQDKYFNTLSLKT